jgi:hypothetical protein
LEPVPEADDFLRHVRFDREQDSLMAVEIIYETHSITTDNETGFATGWLPGQLSDTGRKLAQELGQRRSADGIATVFTSDRMAGRLALHPPHELERSIGRAGKAEG